VTGVTSEDQRAPCTPALPALAPACKHGSDTLFDTAKAESVLSCAPPSCSCCRWVVLLLPCAPPNTLDAPAGPSSLLPSIRPCLCLPSPADSGRVFHLGGDGVGGGKGAHHIPAAQLQLLPWLQHTAQHTAQHSTAQHSTAQHSTAQCTAQHSRAQHNAQHNAQHSRAQHSRAQHSTMHSTHVSTQHSTEHHSTAQHTAQHGTAHHIHLLSFPAGCIQPMVCTQLTVRQLELIVVDEPPLGPRG
jgi:hypothetical protein